MPYAHFHISMPPGQRLKIEPSEIMSYVNKSLKCLSSELEHTFIVLHRKCWLFSKTPYCYLQEIGQALLPSSGDSKSQPAPTEATPAAATATAAPAAETSTESPPETSRPLSPYANVSTTSILQFNAIHK